jgi:acyl carrier protein
VKAVGDELVREINRLLAHILKVPVDDEADVRRANTPTWDSLKHAEVIFALEDGFGVRFAVNDFAALDSTSAIALRLRSLDEA